MQQYEQQAEILKQQEEQLRMQQLQIQRQQEELMRLQQMHSSQAQQQQLLKQNNGNNNGKKNKNQKNAGKGKKGKENEQNSDSNKDFDEFTKTLSLPEGVRINKIAGQPGIVNISSNAMMGGMMPSMMPSMPSGAPMYNMNNMSHLNGMFGGQSLGKSHPTPDQTIIVEGSKKNSKKASDSKPKEESKKSKNKKKNDTSSEEPSPEPSNVSKKNKNNIKASENSNGKKNEREDSKKAKASIARQDSSGSNDSEKSSTVDKRMTADERIQAALNGHMDPERLSRPQRAKYNKLALERNDGTPLLDITGKKKPSSQNTAKAKSTAAPATEKSKPEVVETVTPVLRDSDDESEEEDDLMDLCYNLSVGKKVKGNFSVTGLSISCNRDGGSPVEGVASASKVALPDVSNQDKVSTEASTNLQPTTNSKQPKKNNKKQADSKKEIKSDIKTNQPQNSENKKQNAAKKTVETKKIEKKETKKSLDQPKIQPKAPSSSSTKTAVSAPLPKTSERSKAKEAPRPAGIPVKTSIRDLDIVTTHEEPVYPTHSKATIKTSMTDSVATKTSASAPKSQKPAVGTKPEPVNKVLPAQNRQIQPPQKSSKYQTGEYAQPAVSVQQHQHQPPAMQGQQSLLKPQLVQQPSPSVSISSVQHLSNKAPAVSPLQRFQQLQQQKPQPQQLRQPFVPPQIEHKNVAMQQSPYHRLPLQNTVTPISPLSSLQSQQTIQQQNSDSQVAQSRSGQSVSSTQILPSLQSVFNDSVSQGSYNHFSHPFGPFSNSSNAFGFSNGNAFGNTPAASTSSPFPVVSNHGLGSLGSSAGFSNSTNFLGNSSVSSSMSVNSSVPSYRLADNSGAANNTSSVGGGGYSTSPLSFAGGSSVHDSRYEQFMAANPGPLSSSTYGSSYGSGAMGAIGSSGVGGFGAGGLGAIGGPVNAGLNSHLANYSYVDSPSVDDLNLPYKPNPNAGVIGKKPKKGRKGLEDLTTLDSVFTPQDMMGNMDANDRDVEAFKRFCLYKGTPPSEKPKINFNVNDIHINKKPDGEM